MDNFTNDEARAIRFYFLVGIICKGVISGAEIVVGALAIVIPVARVSDFLNASGQLLPQTVLGQIGTTFFTHAAAELVTAGSSFIAVYLISRGLIKGVLILALIKNQLWAYPWSLVVLGLFVCYQGYQIFTDHSLFIVALTGFDLVIMWLIWKEYRILQSPSIVAQTFVPQTFQSK